jgi:hypothetical protein
MPREALADVRHHQGGRRHALSGVETCQFALGRLQTLSERW